jgi:hypothetical protein
MVKMIEIRKVVQSTLKAIHPRVYFQDAPDDAAPPYLVYDLPNSFDDDPLERFVMDIDGWDKSKDTTALETLMDSIDKEMNKKTIMIQNMAVTFYRENRLSLTDDDPRIIRRKYTYQIRTHV